MAALRRWLGRQTTSKVRRRTTRTGRRRSALGRGIAPRVEQLESRRLLAHVPLPTVVDSNLEVRAVVEGLTTPTTMAFLNEDEFFVLEKNTGQVKLVDNGEVQATALDLAVNFASERGLLGIALHPEFHTNADKQFVYLYWTSTAPPPSDNPFFPTEEETPQDQLLDPDGNGPLGDTDDVLAVPLLGNREDRFVWDAENQTLTFDQNLITLRAFQHDGAPIPAGRGDEEQSPAGNHDGGVIRFGPDGNLYIIIGDVGRRGWLQNLPDGPTGDGAPDDQFGGPEPDDAHLTGAILRLDENGNPPPDNPFFDFGAEFIEEGDIDDAALREEVGQNIQKIFSYGIRNSFGMDFDPISGKLWYQDNGDDSFDELNLVEPGANLGWIQIMGPVERIDQFKEIETG